MKLFETVVRELYFEKASKIVKKKSLILLKKLLKIAFMFSRHRGFSPFKEAQIFFSIKVQRAKRFLWFGTALTVVRMPFENIHRSSVIVPYHTRICGMLKDARQLIGASSNELHLFINFSRNFIKENKIHVCRNKGV